MRLLMLGGTGFVGSAIVAEGVRRGWTVTMFNRGVHGDPPPGVHRLRGDRTAPDGLAALAGGDWDLVVDTWDGMPRAVHDAARALRAAGHYAYVSSCSVYAPPVPAGAGEEATVVEAASDDPRDDDYARCKAGGERAATEVFGERALLLRAGLILGPGEDVGRLPWWLRRVARGGDVLAPGPADLPVQYVDVRDLAAFALDQAAEGVGGAFNVVSRPGHSTMGELLSEMVAATGSDARLRWTDPEPILAAGVEPWNDLPVWIPPGHEYRWLQELGVERAYAAGLTCRPVAGTVGDTWRWLDRVGAVPPRAGRPVRATIGLDPERETALLAAAGPI
ncbi:NAD-dependent epimerase/dehydratase family protein [Micromonospora humidisoli]|uniref:NAD-dependent epimerase/dehydratase family protein n=1 Tax=Micromonospora humidisoli TaxID=2807622 RepID=A0ABS2J639_9ACTN|nr:NAD-dependent epimerase/dehydratase family protein [Micromonospora humidisoli]MBM7081834.1 NAD-dependent epimerase/dehydratase family protein [Micromonospora humidisoli]